jgi:endonuclease/exonuclease/phosphatase family metal-dependent hydrolase
MKKTLKILGIVITIIVVLFYNSTYHPGQLEEESFISADSAPLLQPGEKIKVLNWNIQFMAGNKDNDFFFSDGDDPWPAKETIAKTIKEVARVIESENPDIILLQEVDDGSKRTYHVDQLEELLALLPKAYSSHASSFYWKTRFVPHPRIMGSMGMKLSTISKYKITRAVRHALAPISNQNFLVQQVSIKRAVSEVYLPVANGKNLHVLNAHLSAFAQGSNTMELQVAQVDKFLNEIERSGNYGFIGGDFNLIPPGKQFDLLPEKSKKYYNPKGTEIKLLFDKYKTVPSYEELNGPDYMKWMTAMSTGIKGPKPNKTIDYFMFTSAINYGEHYVRAADTLLISDHLPVITYFTIPE